MNQKGDVYVGILVFIIALVSVGLYVVNIEPLLVSAIQNSQTSGIGTDTYIIIIASSALMLLFAIHRFIKSNDAVTFG